MGEALSEPQAWGSALHSIESQRSQGPQSGLTDPSVDIEGNLRRYLADRDASARYASFDYCFNFFQTYRDQNELPALFQGDALQTACLQIGFYLASWGMFRGSTDLLQRSARVFVPLVEVIVNAAPEIWEVDAHNYGRAGCQIVFDTARQIRAALPGVASDTLVTKIMLATFGCVPAFDSNFKRGAGLWTFSPRALRALGEFHNRNAEAIERYRMQTLDFDSAAPTSRRYPRAKVIDMIFFVAGAPDDLSEPHVRHRTARTAGPRTAHSQDAPAGNIAV